MLTVTEIALDRASMRTMDENSGHLHVSRTPISKSNICPYYGKEIPDFDKLGLNPDKIYNLLRDPAELAKAAASFDGKPLLIKHRPQTAEDHDHDVVVGSISNPIWDAPYLKADLAVWDGEGIKAIESGAQRQLSCGYFYRADMTPGTHQGERYDGRMVDIGGNHVALVDAGRAGPDCFVGDSKPNPPKLKSEITMAKANVSRQALLASGALRAYLRPKLAQDAKIDLTPVLKGVNGKNWDASKPKIKAALDAALAGKLAADADISDIIDMLDQLEDMSDDEVDASAADAEPEDDDKDDKDKSDKDKDDKGKKPPFGKDKGAKDKSAKDDAPAMKPDSEKSEVTKSAMDAAIAKATRDAEAATIARLNGIREAERMVRPYVGDIKVAMDSGTAVLKFALDSLNVDVKGVHESAYGAILAAQPKPGEHKAPTARVAMDAAAREDFAKRYPNAIKLKQH